MQKLEKRKKYGLLLWFGVFCSLYTRAHFFSDTKRVILVLSVWLLLKVLLFIFYLFSFFAVSAVSVRALKASARHRLGFVSVFSFVAFVVVLGVV